jgi:hypothetical protein
VIGGRFPIDPIPNETRASIFFFDFPCFEGARERAHGG